MADFSQIRPDVIELATKTHNAHCQSKLLVFNYVWHVDCIIVCNTNMFHYKNIRGCNINDMYLYGIYSYCIFFCMIKKKIICFGNDVVFCIFCILTK